MSGPATRSDSIRGHYEAWMFEDSSVSPLGDYFGGSGFANYGYWEPDTRDALAACENMMERLLAFVPDRSGAILDVACGLGATTRHLLRYYRPEQVTAVDFSEKNVEYGRTHTPGVTFRQMDATRLQFPDATFDAVLCVEAAFHFQTRDRFLAEALRVLKPGGRIVLADILCDRWAERSSRFLHPENHVADPADYAGVLRRAGFDEPRVEDVTEPCWVRSNRNATRYLCDGFRTSRIDRRAFSRAMYRRLVSLRSVRYYVLGTAVRPADVARPDVGEDFDQVEFASAPVAIKPGPINGLRILLERTGRSPGSPAGGPAGGPAGSPAATAGPGAAAGAPAAPQEKGIPAGARDRITARYDEAMYGDLAKELYEGSDFHNLGYWPEGTTTLKQAAENLVERLLGFIPEKRGTILDVACGKGATTRQLLKHYPPESVVGVNISKKQLESGRVNAPGCAFLAMDATRLAFADASFDNVMCVEAAQDFNTREGFLTEVHRILKPGGRVVFSDILLDSWSENLFAARRGANYLEGPAAYRALCRRIGFGAAEIIDATDECWTSYARHMVRHLESKLISGAIDRGRFNRGMAYICMSVYFGRYYTVGWAQKG